MSFNPDVTAVLFSDAFHVDPKAVDAYGAFNISVVCDLPLFIDPFLLFNSKKAEYQALHSQIIDYLTFLRDKALDGGVDEGLLKAWFLFGEVKETWLGFTVDGNEGHGLGQRFARALLNNFSRLFSEEGLKVTKGQHFEKLCLIAGGVGRDTISDFTTNLIKNYLLEYTQRFAQDHIDPSLCQPFPVERVRFSRETESWVTEEFVLPAYRGSYVLLVPKDILSRDDTWINNEDLVRDFERFPAAIPDAALRSQIDNYFRKLLPDKPTDAQRKRAKRDTIAEFPELIDYYIRWKEENGDKAQSISDEKVAVAEFIFDLNLRDLLKLVADRGFYDVPRGSYENAVERVRFLKHVIEDNDGYRLFWNPGGTPIKRESDLQVVFKLTWFGTEFDVNREVNNGRGPVDYKVSRGFYDSTLIEFKLASNTSLKKNLENQLQIYQKANQTEKGIKVIMFFSKEEREKVVGILNELGLNGEESIFLIDARNDNKPSGSKAG